MWSTITTVEPRLPVLKGPTRAFIGASKDHMFHQPINPINCTFIDASVAIAIARASRSAVHMIMIAGSAKSHASTSNTSDKQPTNQTDTHAQQTHAPQIYTRLDMRSLHVSRLQPLHLIITLRPTHMYTHTHTHTHSLHHSLHVLYGKL